MSDTPRPPDAAGATLVVAIGDEDVRSGVAEALRELPEVGGKPAVFESVREAAEALIGAAMLGEPCEVAILDATADLDARTLDRVLEADPQLQVLMLGEEFMPENMPSPDRIVPSPLHASTKTVVGLVRVLFAKRRHGLSEDNEALYRLEESRQTLALLQEMVGGAIFLVNPKTDEIVEANRHAVVMTGVATREELTGRRFAEFVDIPEDASDASDNILSATLKTTSGQNKPVRRAHSIRHLRTQQVRVEVLVDDHAAAADNAELKHLHQRLHKAERLSALGSLAGGLAYDLRNLMQAITGYASLATENAAVDSVFLERIQTSAAEADRLLEYLVMEERSAQEKRKPCDMAAVLRNTLNLVRIKAPPEVEILREIAEECRPVWADPTQIHQIVLNLCDNALDAMPEGGTLTISLQEMPAGKTAGALDVPHLSLKVSDTGKGIDEATRLRIFNRDLRSGDRLHLGLPAVRDLVEQHEGRLDLQETSEKGSVFCVCLPTCDPSAIEQDEVDLEEETPHIDLTGEESVLFVDEDPALCELMKVALERLGYKITLCNDSESAIAAFEQAPESFDVVAANLTMPRLTGYALARRMFKVREDVPFILCSSAEHLVSPLQARTIGVRGYVRKPYGVEDLAAAIRQAMSDTPAK